jgi:hypothetical protein
LEPLTIDRIVLIAVWIFTIMLLVLFTPRHQLREAQIVFLFKQALTWPLGILVVESGLLSYPVREFPNAINTSFSFEYFIYPATCIIFVLRFPEKRSMLWKIGWYILFPSWMTLLEVLIERYTDLIHYVTWTWYWTWISLCITFFMSRHYYLWYIKHKSVTIGHKRRIG